MNATQTHRLKRITWLVAAAVGVEALLLALATRGPAMASLIRPGYAIVAILFAAAIWHVATRRGARRQVGPDRRDGDRRDPATDGPGN